MGAAIQVDGVSKRFRLNTERHSSLKERVIHFNRRKKPEEFWALREISFDVEQGHTVGLLGHNGSGKSTLLKCTGGILQPTTGEIRTKGRLASLLELGAGFHPDLTGRENVYLNGSILGLTKRDIEARFDDIVGFAVATNVEPDVLLVDEVLAVGDESFQRKCLDRVRQFQKEGRTIVFVTHGADLVRQICDRAVVLDQGHMVLHGTPSEAVRSFREHLLMGDAERLDEEEADPGHDPRVKISKVAIEYPDEARSFVRGGEPLTIRVGYEAFTPTDDVVFVVTFHGSDGHIVWGNNTWAAGVPLPTLHGTGEVAFRYPSVPLLEGTYPVSVGIHGVESGTVFDWREQHEHVDVVNREGVMAWGVADLPVEIDLSGVA